MQASRAICRLCGLRCPCVLCGAHPPPPTQGGRPAGLSSAIASQHRFCAGREPGLPIFSDTAPARMMMGLMMPGYAIAMWQSLCHVAPHAMRARRCNCNRNVPCWPVPATLQHIYFDLLVGRAQCCSATGHVHCANSWRRLWQLPKKRRSEPSQASGYHAYTDLLVTIRIEYLHLLHRKSSQRGI